MTLRKKLNKNLEHFREHDPELYQLLKINVNEIFDESYCLDTDTINIVNDFILMYCSTNEKFRNNSDAKKEFRQEFNL